VTTTMHGLAREDQRQAFLNLKPNLPEDYVTKRAPTAARQDFGEQVGFTCGPDRVTARHLIRPPSTNRFSQRHEPADAPLNNRASLFKQTEPPLSSA
jgi:hypothetical protein